MQRFWLIPLLCLLPIMAQAPPFRYRTATSRQYQVIDIGKVPNFARPGSLAINDSGQIAGEMKGRAFLWDKGKTTYLGAFATGWGDDENPQASESRANGINDLGHIVGGSGGFQAIVMSGLYDCYPFFYLNGRIKNLSREGDFSSFEALGINNHDEVVGIHAHHGFYWSKGKRIEIGTLNNRQTGTWSYSKITAINNKGQFVGDSTVPSAQPYRPKSHAFLWVGPKHSGSMKDLGVPPGYDSSHAAAINDKGEIVGSAITATQNTRALMWRNKQMKLLPNLAGGATSIAASINNKGKIVGWSSKSNDKPSRISADSRAVLWQNDKACDLNSMTSQDSGWTLNEAGGINNRGWIVGCGTLKTEIHIFLLIPS